MGFGGTNSQPPRPIIDGHEVVSSPHPRRAGGLPQRSRRNLANFSRHGPYGKRRDKRGEKLSRFPRVSGYKPPAPPRAGWVIRVKTGRQYHRRRNCVTRASIRRRHARMRSHGFERSRSIITSGRNLDRNVRRRQAAEDNACGHKASTMYRMSGGVPSQSMRLISESNAVHVLSMPGSVGGGGIGTMGCPSWV